jgi:hypothetical protein
VGILAFVSSLITAALWPAVVLAAVIIFRSPLKSLLGRVKSYEGPGGKVQFGDDLARAEIAIEEAVANAGAGREGHDLTLEIENRPLALEAETNPSFVVLQSWEALNSVLADLIGEFLPGSRPGRGLLAGLYELQKQEVLAPGLVSAITELRDLRNAVAHGSHNPTAGEAVAYASAAQEMHDLAVFIMNTFPRNN